MAARDEALRSISAGDLIRASAGSGASFVCLALQIKERTIFARRITTQSVHEFDRATGVEDLDGVPVTINSVAKLPADVREILLGLDRKYREAEYRYAEDPEWNLPEDEARLTKEEIYGLLFVGDFYRAHPI
jgi:hypothetical protein